MAERPRVHRRRPVSVPSGAMDASLTARSRAAAQLGALAVTTSAGAAGLWWLTSGLAAAAGRGGTTFDEAIGLAAVTGCWLCVAWFVLAVTCTAAAAAPGAVGRACGAAAETLAPWTLRTVVVTALGLTVVTGSAAAASPGFPAQLDTTPGSTTLSPVDLTDLLADRTRSDLPPLDRPADGAYAVTVRAGDCLWSIAARHLGPQATDGEIAAAWPRWYELNRGVIGADPNLLQPGQHLLAPH